MMNYLQFIQTVIVSAGLYTAIEMIYLKRKNRIERTKRFKSNFKSRGIIEQHKDRK